MTDRIEALVGLEGMAFEAARSKIISDYIKSLPEDKRKKAYLLQLEIDAHRMANPDSHLPWLMTQLSERMENLADAAQQFIHTHTPPAIRPIHER